MPSAYASGTQTATISTEHTLATITNPGTYVLSADLNNMVSGDTLELRIYTKVLAGSTLRVAFFQSFTGAQATMPAAVSIPMPTTHSFQATLKQTAGTGRNYDWEVIYL